MQDSFLRKVRANLVGMGRKQKKEIISEIRAHLRDEAADLGGGKITVESLGAAIAAMGSPEDIATQFREDETIEVELGTRFLLTVNLAWSISLIVISLRYILESSDVGYPEYTVLGLVGLPVGTSSFIVYLIQNLRPGTIPALRVYVLFPACVGVIVLPLMLVRGALVLGSEIYDFPFFAEVASSLIVLATFLNLGSIALCYYDSKRYPYLFRGIGFVIDGYVRSMSKALKPLDSVTRYSLREEIKSHIEEQSATVVSLPKEEKTKWLEEKMGDSAVDGRRLLELHETRMKTSVRILLYSFVVIGILSLAFGLLVTPTIVWHAENEWGWYYITPEGWASTAVLIVLSVCLVLFVMKQLTYNAKTKDYMFPSLVLFIVVILILSFSGSALAIGSLRPTESIGQEPYHSIEGLFERDDGRYDVYWSEFISKPPERYSGPSDAASATVHHSVLNENGARTSDRILGTIQVSNPFAPRKVVQVADHYFFVDGFSIKILAEDEKHLRSVYLPEHVALEVVEDNDVLGIAWVSRDDERCFLHYGRVTPDGDLEEAWMYNLPGRDVCSRSSLYSVALGKDSVFLVWCNRTFTDNYTAVSIVFEFFSFDGSIKERGTLYHGNVTRSGESDWDNWTRAQVRTTFWLGSKVWTLWSYELIEDGLFENRFLISSINETDGRISNNTIQVQRRDLVELGHDEPPHVYSLPFLRTYEDEVIVSYFFFVRNWTATWDEGEIDHSATGMYVLKVNATGDTVFHVQAYRALTKDSFSIPISAVSNNYIYAIWIDYAEERTDYLSSVPIHMVKLSHTGDLLESKLMLTDVRLSLMIYMVSGTGLEVFAENDKLDIICAGAHPRLGLTEFVFGKSFETPWNSQVLHARISFTNEAVSFHEISSEVTIPDPVLDLLVATVGPALSVGIFQWIFIHSRIWWSRRKGVL
jgi:hypothetical protein